MPNGYAVNTVESILLKKGYQISDDIIPCPPEDVIKEATQEWEQRRKTYIEKIKWRGVADPL